jgi:hypothetical protein
MLSDEFIKTVRSCNMRLYKLAQLVDLHPAVLSHWLCRIFKPKRGDKRLRKIAELLEFPTNKIFVNDPFDERRKYEEEDF